MTNEVQKLERTVRKIRQRIFDLPEAKQPSATAAIGVLRSRISKLAPAAQSQYHWCYAAE